MRAVAPFLSQLQATIHDARFVRPLLAALCAASVVTLTACGGGSICIGLDACFLSESNVNVAISGTAATGTALASASVNFHCVQGSGSTLSDGGGHYSVKLNATLPCIITVTSGNTTLNSLAFASGTFNATPETELMLAYLAAQLGTSETNLIAGLSSNLQFQQVLGNPTDVVAAQSAVVTNLQQRYAITLTAPAFLATPFTVGQAGVDSDLDALAAAGAIDANGMPDQAAVFLLSAAGAANPLTSSTTPPPGTGGAGGGTM
jgi:hypothetical protein